VERWCICGWDASPLRVGGCAVEEGSTSYCLVSTRRCGAAIPFGELYVFLFRNACWSWFQAGGFPLYGRVFLASASMGFAVLDWRRIGVVSDALLVGDIFLTVVGKWFAGLGRVG